MKEDRSLEENWTKILHLWFHLLITELVYLPY